MTMQAGLMPELLLQPGLGTTLLRTPRMLLSVLEAVTTPMASGFIVIPRLCITRCRGGPDHPPPHPTPARAPSISAARKPGKFVSGISGL